MPENDEKKLTEEQRRAQERRELLKLKQGLIEESEILEPTPYQPPEKPHGWKRVENFFYHYKVPVIVGALGAAAVGYMVWQTASMERDDLYVLAVTTQNDSGIYLKQSDIEEALERYCPDFDGNGYVHVSVNFINLSTENGYSQYSETENYRFSSELYIGDSQLYIADSGINLIIQELSDDKDFQFFMNMAEQYPDETFYNDVGLQLNTTDFVKQARWESCSDMVGLYLRDEFENSTANGDSAKQARERAAEVYKNIIEGNIVNPAE